MALGQIRTATCLCIAHELKMVSTFLSDCKNKTKQKADEIGQRTYMVHKA